ncbi:MAG: MarR family transcriptional regulator [Bacilli bacterium]
MDQKKFGYWIKYIYNSFEKSKNKSLEILDITSSQADVLMYLLHNKDEVLNQKDLEKEFNLKNSTINGILNRLENKNFIVRKTNDKDGRFKDIYLTELSFNAKEEIINRMKELNKDIFKEVSEEDICTFFKVVKKVSKNMKEDE